MNNIMNLSVILYMQVLHFRSALLKFIYIYKLKIIRKIFKDTWKNTKKEATMIKGSSFFGR